MVRQGGIQAQGTETLSCYTGVEQASKPGRRHGHEILNKFLEDRLGRATNTEGAKMQMNLEGNLVWNLNIIGEINGKLSQMSLNFVTLE